jgi:hypothetical protein
MLTAERFEYKCQMEFIEMNDQRWRLVRQGAKKEGIMYWLSYL